MNLVDTGSFSQYGDYLIKTATSIAHPDSIAVMQVDGSNTIEFAVYEKTGATIDKVFSKSFGTSWYGLQFTYYYDGGDLCWTNDGKYLIALIKEDNYPYNPENYSVVRINYNDGTVTDITANLPNKIFNITASTTDNTAVYVGLEYGAVKKIDIETFTVVDEVTPTKTEVFGGGSFGNNNSQDSGNPVVYLPIVPTQTFNASGLYLPISFNSGTKEAYDNAISLVDSGGTTITTTSYRRLDTRRAIFEFDSDVTFTQGTEYRLKLDLDGVSFNMDYTYTSLDVVSDYFEDITVRWCRDLACTDESYINTTVVNFIKYANRNELQKVPGFIMESTKLGVSPDESKFAMIVKNTLYDVDSRTYKTSLVVIDNTSATIENVIDMDTALAEAPTPEGAEMAEFTRPHFDAYGERLIIDARYTVMVLDIAKNEYIFFDNPDNSYSAYEAGSFNLHSNTVSAPSYLDYMIDLNAPLGTRKTYGIDNVFVYHTRLPFSPSMTFFLRQRNAGYDIDMYSFTDMPMLANKIALTGPDRIPLVYTGDSANQYNRPTYYPEIRYAEESEVKPLVIRNYTDVDVTNVTISANSVPAGVTVYFSKTGDFLDQATSITFTEVIDKKTGKTPEFYIKIETTTIATEGAGSLDLEISADNYVA